MYAKNGAARGKPASGFIIPIIAGVFNILIILFPADMISAARDGLWLWLDSVVPSLLPFIILTNLLSGSGAFAAASGLLEPLMRPLFNVPGAGGLALIAGAASGYPVGAKITGQLRAEGRVSRAEAERLLAFCNNSGPLFMLGAVGVSMFGSVRAGYFIMGIHYLSAVITGLAFSRLGGKGASGGAAHGAPARTGIARDRNKGVGAALGASVKNAVETLALVGGFIVFFSVAVKALEITGVTALAGAALSKIPGVSARTGRGLAVGLLEVTNGARVLAGEGFSRGQAAAVCGSVAFGGLCVHAQALSLLSHTDIRPWAYIAAKAAHAAVAAAAAALLFPLAMLADVAAVPVFLVKGSPFLHRLAFSAASLAAACGAAAVCAAGAVIWKGARRVRRRRYTP